MHKKIVYEGRTYILANKEESLPEEFIMFEGVTYRRKESVKDHMKKSLTEATNKAPSDKIIVGGKVFHLSESQKI
jgi:hypothetical protein